MHCGPPNENFGWAKAQPAHPAAPPMIPANCIQNAKGFLELFHGRLSSFVSCVQIFCCADLLRFSVRVCHQMCDYLNIYCFKVSPPSQPMAQAAAAATAGRPVPCNGSAGRSAVDTLLRRDRAAAADSSRSSSASSSSDMVDTHHVTTRSQMAQARALRFTQGRQQ